MNVCVDLNALPARIREKIFVEPNSGCWLWTMSINKAGYGHYQPTYRGKSYRAHRWVWEFFYGDCPLELDHLCKTKCCVNPLHLDAVTHTETMRRYQRTVSLKTHCKNGHEFTVENTGYWDKRNRSHRCCRQCMKERHRQWILAGGDPNR